MKEKSEEALTIPELFPTLTAEEVAAAEENLNGYIDLALEIYEKICRDPDRYRRFRALTEDQALSKIESTGHNKNTNTPSSP